VFATSRSDGWHDGVTTVTARLGDGGLASTVVLEGTAASNEVDVYGSGGHLRASLYRFDGLEVSPVSGSAGDLRARLGGVARSVTSVPAAVSALRGGGVWAGSYRAQWSHFLDCIRDGVAPGCTLVDGRRALEVALAAAQSASVGRPVSVGAAPRRIPAVT
jgi:predicted dehydrogenase